LLATLGDGGGGEELGDVWVNFSHPGDQFGTRQHPFNTLAGGLAQVASGGTVRIVSGTTGETARITQPVRLVAEAGPVALGRASGAPLLLQESETHQEMGGPTFVLTTEELLALIEKHFDEIDLDGDGILSLEELHRFFLARGIKLPEGFLEGIAGATLASLKPTVYAPTETPAAVEANERDLNGNTRQASLLDCMRRGAVDIQRMLGDLFILLVLFGAVGADVLWRRRDRP
jgi:hypothetical protein